MTNPTPDYRTIIATAPTSVRESYLHDMLIMALKKGMEMELAERTVLFLCFAIATIVYAYWEDEQGVDVARIITGNKVPDIQNEIMTAVGKDIALRIAQQQ